MYGERPIRDRRAAAGAGASALIRAAEVSVAGDPSRFSRQVAVCRVAGSADGTAALLLRTGPHDGVADTDFIGPIYMGAGHPVEFKYDLPTGRLPPERDLFWEVAAAGGVNWSVETDTVIL